MDRELQLFAMQKLGFHGSFLPQIKRAASPAALFISLSLVRLAARQLSLHVCVPPSAFSSSLICAAWRLRLDGGVLSGLGRWGLAGRAWNLAEQIMPDPGGPVQLPTPKEFVAYPYSSFRLKMLSRSLD